MQTTLLLLFDGRMSEFWSFELFNIDGLISLLGGTILTAVSREDMAVSLSSSDPMENIKRMVLY